MLYKPSTGRFKDACVVQHEGKYYLFTMHTPGEKDVFQNMWMAVSPDGVHWEDIGPVIENAPFKIWAMAVHRVGDRFIMNHGSFTRSGVQNVIRFWESTDLVHWRFIGHDADLTPDPRWYDPYSRLDCMSVIKVLEDGKDRYYGYATGPGGFLKSDDGIVWSGMPPPEVDWDGVPPPPTPEDEGGFEIGGCREIGGRYYLVGGWFNYMGSTGYGVYTLIGDTPTGPFRADAPAYRLCGNSDRWVSMWARFIEADDALLVNGYMYSGYSYETGETWLPPLKKAVVDSGTHLRLAYWDGNDVLKGARVSVDLSRCLKVYPKPDEACSCTVTADGVYIQAGQERGSFFRADIPTTIAVLDSPLDFAGGVVVEGTMTATCGDPRLVASSVGFYLEEASGEGTGILLHGYGKTEIGRLTLGDSLAFDVEDTIGPGCAAPAGIVPHIPHTFRLLARKKMFEFYLDDMLVQTFNTTHDPGNIGRTPRRLGFIVQNGRGIIGNLRVWSMSLGG